MCFFLLAKKVYASTLLFPASTLVFSATIQPVEPPSVVQNPLPDLSLAAAVDNPEAAFDLIAAANIQPADTLDLDSPVEADDEKAEDDDEEEDLLASDPEEDVVLPKGQTEEDEKEEEEDDEEEIALDEVWLILSVLFWRCSFVLV